MVLVVLGVLGAGLALGLHVSRRVKGATIPILFGFGLLMGGRGLGLLPPGPVVEAATEVGLLLMLFYTSLFGNPRALRDGGRIGLPLAAYDLVLNFAVAWWIGGLLGWSVQDRLFLAGIIATSSTAVVLKLLGDEGRITRREGNVLVSMLLFEDWVFLGFFAFLGFRYADLASRSLLAIAVGVAAFVIFLIVLRVARPAIWSIQNRELLIAVLTSIGLMGAYLGTSAGLPSVGSAFTTGLILSGDQGARFIQREAPYLRDAASALFFVGYAALLGPTLSLDVLPLLGLALGGVVVTELLFLPVLARRLGLRRSEAFVVGALLLPRGGKSAAFARLYPMTPGSPPLFPLAGLLAVVLTPMAPLIARIGLRLSGRPHSLGYAHPSEAYGRTARSLLMPSAYGPRRPRAWLERLLLLEWVVLTGLLAVLMLTLPRPFSSIVAAVLAVCLVPLGKELYAWSRPRPVPHGVDTSLRDAAYHRRAFDHMPLLLMAPLGMLLVFAVASPWSLTAYPIVIGVVWLAALALPWLRPSTRRAPPLARVLGVSGGIFR